MATLSDFVLRQIDGRIVIKKMVDSHVFFDLIDRMGVSNDLLVLAEIMEGLKENSIDLNFREDEIDNYRRYKQIEKLVKLSKSTKMRGQYFNELLKKIDEVEIKIEPSYLETYRNDKEE